MRNKRITSFILIIALAFSTLIFQGFSFRSSATSEQVLATNEVRESSELRHDDDNNKFISQATLDDNFSDDMVILTMTKQASLDLKAYRSNDFPEVRADEVKTLSASVEANVREQLSEARNGNDIAQSKSIRDTSWDIDVENFRQIISLTLQTPGKENVLSAIEALEKRSDVYAAEPNYIALPGSLANMRSQSAVTRVNLPDAWAITNGSADITVGIMDTGVDISRPDLANRLHPANSNMHGDFTGSAISPLTDSGFPHAYNGHGTHVSGMVGPICAWNVRLASLRVFSTVNAGAGLQSVLDAIDHARLRNIDILNFSANGYPYSVALENRIRDYGRPFITSAGNDNIPLTPASNHIGNASRAIVPNLIVVGATNHNNDNRASFSNHGASTVDIFAPGTSIYSTVPTAVNSIGFATWQGTSFAAPMVAGVAALILSKYPHFRPSQIKTAIMWGVDLVPALSNRCVAGGRLNAAGALANAALFPPPQIRYIRDWANGSTVNTDNHWVQIGAYESRDSDTPWSDGAGNWAYIGDYPRPNAVTASTPLSLYGASTNMWGANRIINGDIDSSQYVATSGNGLEWIQVDLGQLRTVRQIWIWHYYADSRIYYQTRTQVSADSITWFDAFNSTTHGTYHETVASNRIWL